MSNDDQGMTHYFTPEQEAREKMRADFEAEFDRIRKMNWVVELPMPSHFMMHEKDPMWVSWQACAAQSAETIARMEGEKRTLILAVGDHVTYRAEQQKTIARLEESAKIWHGRYTNACQKHADRLAMSGSEIVALEEKLAAAQDDNVRLRGKLKDCVPFVVNNPPLYHNVVELVNSPLDTSALEAYVAKRMEPVTQDATRYRWLRNVLAVEDVERLAREFFGEPDEAESAKTDKAIDSGMKECPIFPAPDKQGE